MRILIVGDLSGYLTDTVRILMTRGSRVTQVKTADLALKAMRSGPSADLLLMDLDEDIPHFLARLRQERIQGSVVACGTGSLDEERVTQALQAGAKEYIALPPDAELIADMIEALLKTESVALFHDPKIREVMLLADRIAPSEASVLITGESGTGKEVMARYIHNKSHRKDKPFISINCAAIPENLLESELFGHEKGAFTGAIARRIGKFEEASGGTLLLDEISEMHHRLQAKLLRAVQEREIDRVGGGKPVHVDIRVLATSNRDLQAEIKAGRFREDLYFRLNVVNLCLPALRERPDDIPPLARHFIDKYIQINGLPPRQLSEEALAEMKAYPWPGNVRELENTMHRAVLLADGGCILPPHLILKLDPTDEDFVGQTVASVEKKLILSTVDRCAGDDTKAAHLLGLSLRALRIKLEEYGRTLEGEPSDEAKYRVGHS